MTVHLGPVYIVNPVDSMSQITGVSFHDPIGRRAKMSGVASHGFALIAGFVGLASLVRCPAFALCWGKINIP